MNYVIIQISGKQLLLKPNQWYDIDLVKQGNLNNYLFLNRILLYKQENKVQIGFPLLKTSQLPVKIIKEIKGKKLTVLKTKPKKKYTRTKGHRTIYTRIQVDPIN